MSQFDTCLRKLELPGGRTVSYYSLEALAQTLEMVRHHRVRTLDGTWAAVRAETVCLHGDGEHALEYARTLRQRFAVEGINVSAE